MPSLLHDVPVLPPPHVPPRKLWTREQCAVAQASGIFDGETLELINGELISKMGKNRPHVVSLAAMFIWLVEVFGRGIVNSEGPIDVTPADNPTNEPQPDLIVLNRHGSTIRGNPQPQDLRMVVEVSDSSLAFDMGAKSALYARAGIPEYWVLDVANRRVIVHREPSSEGYRSVTAYAENESVAPLAAPQHAFCWATVMAPPQGV